LVSRNGAAKAKTVKFEQAAAMMVEKPLHRAENDSQRTIVFTVEGQEIKHAATELTLGMLKKKTKCPTISKESQQWSKVYSRRIYFQEHRWLKR
jgi:hypothetical protein